MKTNLTIYRLRDSKNNGWFVDRYEVATFKSDLEDYEAIEQILIECQEGDIIREEPVVRGLCQAKYYLVEDKQLKEFEGNIIQLLKHLPQLETLYC
jgi:hypothetical protein